MPMRAKALAAAALLLAGGLAAAQTSSSLQNGVPRTGLSAATGTNLNFTMDVPAGATNLRFVTSGGTGDSDLYVRFGAAPTLSTYNCRPYSSGNNETCTFASPQTGRYFVMLNAYTAFSGLTLTGSYTGGTGNTPPVANFSFTTSGLTANFTDTSTDTGGSIAARSWNFGDGTTSTAANPAKTYSTAGTRTVTLTVTDNQGATGSTSKSVTVSSTTPPPPPNVQALLKGLPRTGLSGATGSAQYFTLHVHGAPPTNLVFQTSGGTGDVDMYVKHGSVPTTTVYDCRPYLSSNNETCNFATVAEGSWYVMLRGYSAYSGVTLKGDYNDNNTTPPPPPPPNPPPVGNVPNACATKAPVYDAPLTKGVVECVTGSPGPGFYRHFYIRLAAADAGKTLTIRMGNGTGNANMLVATDLGLFPHEEHYLARPDIVFGSTGPTNEETVVVTNAKAGQDYLITLPAVTAHAGISIVATVP